jgi:hypothetical protein
VIFQLNAFLTKRTPGIKNTQTCLNSVRPSELVGVAVTVMDVSVIVSVRVTVCAVTGRPVADAGAGVSVPVRIVVAGWRMDGTGKPFAEATDAMADGLKVGPTCAARELTMEDA